MKIKNGFPQFHGRKSLLLVSGEQKAEFFIAENGFVAKIDSLIVPTPKYSDREGLFAQSGKRGIIASGSVYEQKKQHLEKRTVKSIKEKVSLINRKETILNDIYLFAPDYMMNSIEKAFPFPLRQKIVLFIRGNFTDCHPFDLLDRIKQQQEKRLQKRTFIKEEARKILNKAIK